ncbi:MAG: tetratricopeptide repeat protein [Nitrospira sp.]|nr:tetratricopeptide repeat protein [Nitrospira sp.]
MESTEDIHPSGTLIADKYEVVLGPREKKHLMGGMGLVYLCMHIAKDFPVALKTFQSKYFVDRNARDRFLREGTLWVELGWHPFIVKAIGVERMANGREVYLVLEYIDTAEGKIGASLREWLCLRKTPIPPAQSLRWMWEVAQGLAYATQRIPGFVHRDLKPENILIGRDGHARVTDLGLARCLTARPLASTEPVQPSVAPSELMNLQRTQLTKGAIGTPLYMAPEQWNERNYLDQRTDIYAWGSVLLELITGQKPLSSKTKGECEMQHTTGCVRHAAQYLPAGIRELVCRCVAVDPTERFSTWSNLLQEFEQSYPNWTQMPLPKLSLSPEEGRDRRVGNGWTLNTIGQSYLDISKPKIAMEYFKKVQDIGEAEQDPDLQETALNNLGCVYQDLGDPKRATIYHEQYLACVRKIGDPAREGYALGNVGNSYAGLGDFQRALTYHEQALAIAREMGNRHGELQALGNVGNAYLEVGEPKRAITCYEQSLAIVREMDDPKQEGTTLGCLGVAYRNLGDLERALRYFKKALTIALEIGDRAAEGRALGNLGVVHRNLGELQRALGCFEEALGIAREIGDRAAEGQRLASLGTGYLALEDLQRALGCFEEALVIAREIGDRALEGMSLGNLGNTHHVLGNNQKATNFLNQAVVTYKSIKARAGEALGCLNLALCWNGLGDRLQSRTYAEFALAYFTETGHGAHAQKAQQLLTALDKTTGGSTLPPSVRLQPSRPRKEISTMSEQLVTKDTLSRQVVKDIFDNAYLETEDEEGDTFMVRDGYNFRVAVDSDKRFVHFRTIFGFREGALRQDQLEYVNDVNAGLIFIRASIINNFLIFDYYLFLEGGTTKKTIFQAYKFFQAIVGASLKKDTRGVLE